MPQGFIQAAIIKRVRALPRYPELSVLDLSCGRGGILATFMEDGCTVRGTHYRQDDYKLSDTKEPTYVSKVPIDDGVDLTMPLPYADESYDVVILSEVIEHLPNHIPIMAEIGRVLRTGGRLVLSTPNIARVHSRLHFLFTGTHKLIRRRVGWDLASDELYAYHINPVDFPLLHTILRQNRLRLTDLSFTRFKLKHAWLLLGYPLFWVATRIETAGRGNEDWKQGERDLFRWMIHPAILASEQLLMTARKQ